MEVTVRVMSRGQEIDRITRPLRTDGRKPAVSYRKLLWPVKDGCIHIETEHATLAPDRRLDADEWGVLVTCLLPAPLPTQRYECSALLRTCFSESLPDGVVRALSSLAYVGLEEEARQLLADFLSEKHDSALINRRMRMQLLRSEMSGNTDLSANKTPSVESAELKVDTGTIAEDENLDGWDWAPAAELQIPKVDDQALRDVARHIQGAIGAYRSSEQGAVVPDFNEPFEASDWSEGLVLALPGSVTPPMESILVERTVRLGAMALDVLRYFADNPGDRSAHAELVLGYPVSDINKLLLGSLSHHLKRNGSGGWECHSWVSGVLAALDDVL